MSQCLIRLTIPTEMQDYEENAGNLLHCLPLVNWIGDKVEFIASVSQAKKETIPKLCPALITWMMMKCLHLRNHG